MVTNGDDAPSGGGDDRTTDHGHSSRRTFLKATGGAAAGAAVAGCLGLGGGNGTETETSGGSGETTTEAETSTTSSETTTEAETSRVSTGTTIEAETSSVSSETTTEAETSSASSETTTEAETSSASSGTTTGAETSNSSSETTTDVGTSSASGGSDDIEGSITIGVLAPNPEKDPIGGSIVSGAQLAVQQLNADGGIGGANVELAIGNTKADPATGQQRYRELVLNKNADVTTGIFTSEVLLNIMDDIAQQKTLHITAGAATTKASRMVATNYDKYKYHFRAGPLNNVDLARSLLDFGSANFGNIGWDSTYAMLEDYQWTKPISKRFKQDLESTGTNVAGIQRYASGTNDFGPLFDSVESSNANGMFTAMAHTGTAAVVQWAKQQRPFGFAGIHVPMQLPSYYEAVEGACLYGVTQTSATPQSTITEKTQPFVKAYNEKFDSYPVYTGYITYDAIKLYAAMVEQTGSKNADELIPALEDASFTATTGTAKFYGKDKQYPHDPVYGEDAIYPPYLQWQTDGNGGGVQEVIWPDAYKTADYQPPAWI